MPRNAAVKTVAENIGEEYPVFLRPLQSAQQGVVDNGYVLQLLHLLNEVSLYLKACGILMVSYSAARVTALQRERNTAVVLEVELHAVFFLKLKNLRRTLLH